MANRRKILLLMEATIGGTRRHLMQLAVGLPKDRYEVFVAASAERDVTFRADLERMRAAGCGTAEVPMVRSPSWRRDREQIATLRALLRSGRFDVVHTHSSKAGALGRYASIRERIGRRVHTPHTFAFAFAGGFSPPKRALFYAIEKWLGRTTDRLICVSPSEAEQARSLRIVRDDRIRVVPNGVDPAPFAAAPSREQARAQLGWDTTRPTALVVALINRAKGQLEAAEALARIDAAARPRLVFAGAVSDAAYAAEVDARVASLGLEPWITKLGHRDDVPRLLAACNLVLVPSRWEGMPYSVLEAMAAGRGVLATATNGSRDAVIPEVTGELVPVGDAAALAQRWMQLAADPRRCDALGAAGRARVLEHYSIERMIAATAAVYDEVCA